MCTAKIEKVKMFFVNVVIKSVTYYQNYSVYLICALVEQRETQK